MPCNNRKIKYRAYKICSFLTLLSLKQFHHNVGFLGSKVLIITETRKQRKESSQLVRIGSERLFKSLHQNVSLQRSAHQKMKRKRHNLCLITLPYSLTTSQFPITSGVPNRPLDQGCLRLGTFKLIKILFGSVQISRIYLRFYCLLFRKSDC